MCSQALKLFISVLFIASQISANKGKHRTEKSDEDVENFDINTFDFNAPEHSKYLKNEVQQKDAVTYELGAPQYRILNPDEPPEIIMHGQPNYFDNLKRYGQLTGEEEREFGDAFKSATTAVGNKNETKATSESVEVKQPNQKNEEAHEKVEYTKNEEIKEIPKKVEFPKKQDKVVARNQNETEPNYTISNNNSTKEVYNEKHSYKTDNDYQQKHNDRELEHDQKEHQNKTISDSGSQQNSTQQHGESTIQVKSQHENSETTQDGQVAETSTSEHSPSNKLDKSYATAPSPDYYQNYQTQDIAQKVPAAPTYSTTYTNNNLYQQSIAAVPSYYPKYQPEYETHRSDVTTIPFGYYPNYRPNIQHQQSIFEFTRAPQQYPNYHSPQHMSPSLYYRSNFGNMDAYPYSNNNYQNNYKSIEPPHLRDLEQLYRKALESHHRLSRSHNSQQFHHPIEKQIYPREKYYYYIKKISRNPKQ